MIYGEQHIQHKAAVSYVSVCFYKEITFISKPEGWWEKLSQGPYSILHRKEGKSQHKTLQKILYCSFGITSTTKA